MDDGGPGKRACKALYTGSIPVAASNEAASNESEGSGRAAASRLAWSAPHQPHARYPGAVPVYLSAAPGLHAVAAGPCPSLGGMRSFYNDYLKALGLPEMPPCEECGQQIRRNLESPWNVVLEPNDADPEIHRFCGVGCAKSWLDRRAAS